MFDSMTDQQLVDELARRKAERETKTPEPLAFLERNQELWLEIEKMCVKYVEGVEITGICDEDADGYIFEAIMEYIYGPKIFEWVRSKQR